MKNLGHYSEWLAKRSKLLMGLLVNYTLFAVDTTVHLTDSGKTDSCDTFS